MSVSKKYLKTTAAGVKIQIKNRDFCLTRYEVGRIILLLKRHLLITEEKNELGI